MKKLITFFAVLALAMPVLAQDYDFEPEQKWTVKTTAAYVPTVSTLVGIFGGIFVGIAVSVNEDNNETLSISLPPYFSVSGSYSFNDRWSVGLNSGYCGTVWSVVDKDDHSNVHSRQYITFIPITVEGRFNYLNRPKFKLYGSLEAGAMLSFSNDFQVIPDVQLNPIGLEFGRRFFGSLEAGIGMNYFGGRVGVGYRF